MGVTNDPFRSRFVHFRLWNKWAVQSDGFDQDKQSLDGGFLQLRGHRRR